MFIFVYCPVIYIYKVGYRSKDACSKYLELGSPEKLNRDQVEIIRGMNDGHPVFREIIECSAEGIVEKEFPIHENDVYLFLLTKIFN